MRMPEAEFPDKPAQCPKPPEGWECSRKAGHDGPCAAEPKRATPAPQ